MQAPQAAADQAQPSPPPRTLAEVLKDLPALSDESAEAWDRVMREIKNEPQPPLRDIDWT